MELLTVTKAEQQDMAAESVVSREREIAAYRLNVEQYTAALVALPADEWPEHLTQFKNRNPHDLTAMLADNDMELVASYSIRDRMRALIRSEKIECQKCELLHGALLKQLPADSRLLLQAAKTRLDAK